MIIICPICKHAIHSFDMSNQEPKSDPIAEHGQPSPPIADHAQPSLYSQIIQDHEPDWFFPCDRNDYN
jgi:hypothetical protein